MNTRLAFDLLYSKGLDPNRFNQIGRKLNSSTIYQIVNDVNGYLNFESDRGESYFDIMPNSYLSGSPDFCSDFPVRTSNVDKLLRQSLLFADVIWIKNPLDDYYNQSEDIFSNDEGLMQLYENIKILFQYEYLIYEGIVKICNTDTHFCRHCLMESKNDVPSKYYDVLDDIEELVFNKFMKEANYFISEYDNGKATVRVENKKGFLRFPVAPLLVSHEGYHNEFKEASTRKTKKIYQRELKKSEFLCHFVNAVMDDIVMQDYYSNKFELTYFTDRDIDSQIMSLLSTTKGVDPIQQMNGTISHAFPFVNNVGLDKILELRIGEKEAFVQYRNSMDRFLRNSKNLSFSEIQEKFNDEVRENLDKIDVTVKNSKSKLTTGGITSAVIGAGIISIGMQFGVLPAGIASAFILLSNSAHGAKAVNDLTGLLRGNHDVRPEKYYFLWKLKN